MTMGIEGVFLQILDFGNLSTNEGIIESIGEIGLWIQAIGLLVIIWLVFQVVNIIVNIKRGIYLRTMKKKIDVIEKKVDSLVRKRR